MRQPILLVTGSSGLIGSEVVTHFYHLGWKVYGMDSNQRAVFFGPDGDTQWNLRRLTELCPDYTHYDIDVRDRKLVNTIVAELEPDAIVHAAAQPSHDLAAKIPFDDFDTNAVGTLNLLEAVRLNVPECIFVFLSTNKVYGDWPNKIPLIEMKTRWEYAPEALKQGIRENTPIDQSLHSVFGASKVAADVLVQEYSKSFGLVTCCLRCGCLTGAQHSGVELHGFLSYLVKCNIEQRLYTIYGYKGKQVRDNIHAIDVSRFIETYIRSPRAGEVYNLGGGKENSCSLLEAFEAVAALTGKTMNSQYSEQARKGDHICYYSDLRKLREHYPEWEISLSLSEIFEDIVKGWHNRKHTRGSAASMGIN